MKRSVLVGSRPRRFGSQAYAQSLKLRVSWTCTYLFTTHPRFSVLASSAKTVSSRKEVLYATRLRSPTPNSQAHICPPPSPTRCRTQYLHVSSMSLAEQQDDHHGRRGALRCQKVDVCAFFVAHSASHSAFAQLPPPVAPYFRSVTQSLEELIDVHRFQMTHMSHFIE